MKTFAKLYQVDGIGQILVKQDTSDDEGRPEVQVFFSPPNIGVCKVGLAFTDDDNGWQKCDAAFEGMTEERATELVRAQLESEPFKLLIKAAE